MNRWGKVLYPEAFKGGYIRTHWDYENDLKDILERSGKKDDFTSKYKMRLKFLTSVVKTVSRKEIGLRYLNMVTSYMQ
jgi:hypothetical protein